jgi:hypothetical protein
MVLVATQPLSVLGQVPLLLFPWMSTFGSPPVQSKEAVVTHLSTALTGLVTLVASDPDAGSLPPADEAEVPLSRALDIIAADLPSSSNALTLPTLGLPLFLSNLQVNQLSLFYCSH